MTKSKHFNVLIVGDKGTGKTTFIEMHTNQDGSNDNEKTSTVDGHPFEFHVKYHEYDEQGSEERYKDKDLILCCFAVNDVATYKKLESFYIVEARKYAIPMLAVGTKCDLRDDPSRDDMVSIEQGIEMSEKVGASAYLECSAKDGETFDLDQLQEEIVKIILHNQDSKDKKTSNFSFGIVKFILGR